MSTSFRRQASEPDLSKTIPDASHTEGPTNIHHPVTQLKQIRNKPTQPSGPVETNTQPTPLCTQSLVALGLGHGRPWAWPSASQSLVVLGASTLFSQQPSLARHCQTTSSQLILFLLLLWLVHPWPCALELTMKGSSSPGSSGSFAWRAWRTLLILLSRSRSSSVAGPVSASVACSQAVKLAPERLCATVPSGCVSRLSAPLPSPLLPTWAPSAFQPWQHFWVQLEPLFDGGSC